MSETRPRRIKVIWIVLLCILVAAGIGGIWLDRNYKGIIDRKLPAAAAKATDSLYQVDAGDVDIDLLGRRVVISDFEFIPDPAHVSRLRQDFDLPQMLLSIHIDKVTIEDVAWGEVLRTQEIVCGSMTILNPVVRITKLADKPKDSADDKKPSRIQAIRAGKITILNPDVRFVDGPGEGAAGIAIKGGRIELADWFYDLRQPNDTSRLFYASRTAFRLSKLALIQPGSLSRIESGAISYDQKSGNVAVKGLRIEPAVSTEEFYRRTPVQKEIYDVHFPEIRLNGLGWKPLLQQGAIIAESGSIRDAVIKIFMSRVPPPGTANKNGKFPHQLLMKMKQNVFIPRLDIMNGQLAYTEKNEKSMAEGVIPINRINGSVSNITNMPERLRKNNVCTIDLKSDFLGSDLTAKFRLMLNSKAGAFTVDGEQSPMDGTKLNSITKPLALTEIKSLKLNGVKFHLKGDEKAARGEIRMRYEDLKSHQLKVADDKELEKKHLLTFLGNTLLIHDANPQPGKSLRVVHPVYERDNTKSFFNLIWNTLFTGTLQTVSKKLIKLDKVVNEKKEAQEEERKGN